MKHLTLSLSLLALVLAGCSSAEQPSENGTPTSQARAIRVETMVVQPEAFTDIIELTGTVESLDDATLSARASGTIQQIASVGSLVGAGQTVAQIDAGLSIAAREQAEAALEAAEAQFELAEDTYRRQEPLFRDSVISAIEFQRTRAQLNQAQAQVNQARAALRQASEQVGNTRVVAPFSGIVEEKLVERGEQVAPGTPVARIVSTARVKVTTGVPERYVTDIRVGTPVRVVFNAYNVPPMAGRVTFVGSAINPDSRTFPIEVELSNPNGQLKPQMIANLQIAREEMEGAIVVPQTAVLRDEMGAAVFVVENGVAQRRDVMAGVSNAGRTVITSGLAAGEEVVIVGQQNLTTGDTVEIAQRRTSQDVAAETVSPEVE